MICCAFTGSVSAQQDSDVSPLAARLDGLAEGLMAREQVPGAIAAVVSGDQVIVRGYGVAGSGGQTAVGPDTFRFEIGSITKLFTWVAVMMLVEDGRLDLRADVSNYLPGFDIPGGEPLTLAHLMSHRGGFEESYAIFDQDIAALPRAEALAVAAPDQVFPRGEITSYSNWGAALAGLVVEEVSGQPWEAFVQARILDPLRMGDTTLAERLRQSDQPPLAQSYAVRGGIAHPAFRIDIGAFGPAGATASTASDMAWFLRFLMGDGALEGARLLEPGTMAQMRTRLFDERPQAADMAHGFQSRPRFGTMVYGHGGGLNEFISNLVFIPEIGAGVFISQNGGAGASLPLFAPDLILAELAADAGLAAPEAPPVPEAATRAAEAAGRYVTNRRTFSGPGQALAALSPINVVAFSDGALLIPTGTLPMPSRFDPIAPDLWQDAMGHRVTVIRDAQGRVTRLADGTGAQTHERVRGLADPVWLTVGFALALLLATTSIIGLIWRHGLRGGSRVGTLAAAVQVTGAIAVWALAVAGVAMALAASRLGSQFLFDQPQPTFELFLGIAAAVAVLAAVLALSLPLVWRAPGWSLWRRTHQTAFTLALIGLAGLMLKWGLAFGGPI
ncbi:serine hydrolase domain-containing protein [Loktanella sp. 5RATIMAR09]|uniref:serine hydrolase domain-containing protein n=1 Tax=Loktanella sp. 5RATIMAR09 TaxID=1225655 RepID=UPI00256FFBF2|nr:serine hydrolase domain-containing protein [Loktanella sp. 5RATIMAR09]